MTNQNDDSPINFLLQLLENGDFEGAQKLIQDGFDINKKNSYGFTALHIVVFEGKISLAKSLLELGANPNVSALNTETDVDVSDVPHSIPEEKVSLSLIHEIQSLQYITPLQIAISKDKEEMTSLLLTHKADPNLKDLGGCTPLHWAATKGNERIVDLLLHHSVDINAEDIAQSTPLHEAVRKNYFSIAMKLLKAGADPTRKDITGTTPLDVAKEKNNNLYLSLLDFIDKPPEDFSIH